MPRRKYGRLNKPVGTSAGKNSGHAKRHAQGSD